MPITRRRSSRRDCVKSRQGTSTTASKAESNASRSGRPRRSKALIAFSEMEIR